MARLAPQPTFKDVAGYEPGEKLKACFCVGPQHGQTQCPCALRGARTEAWDALKKALEEGRIVFLPAKGPAE